MNLNSYLCGLVMSSLLLVGCGEDQEVSRPAAGFTVKKATSVLSIPSDSVTLLEGTDVVFRAGDTLMFESLCTGTHNYLYTGDSIINDRGEVDRTRIADEDLDITYDFIEDRYVRTEALLFPAQGQDLIDLYGYPARRQYQNANGEYYRGVRPYVYSYPSQYRVKVFSVNYSDDGSIFSIDTASSIITVLDSIP